MESLSVYRSVFSTLGGLYKNCDRYIPFVSFPHLAFLISVNVLVPIILCLAKTQPFHFLLEEIKKFCELCLKRQNSADLNDLLIIRKCEMRMRDSKQRVRTHTYTYENSLYCNGNL